MPNIFSDLPDLEEKPKETKNIFGDLPDIQATTPSSPTEPLPSPTEPPTFDVESLRSPVTPPRKIEELEPSTPEEISKFILAPQRDIKGEQLYQQLERARKEGRKYNDETLRIYDVGDKPKSDVVPFWGGIKKAADLWGVYRAAKRTGAGDPNPGDHERLDEFLKERKKQSGPQSIGYQTMNILTELPAFFTELMLTAGIYQGVSTGVKKGLLKGAEKSVDSTIRKAAATSIGKLAGVAAQTAAARPGHIVAGTIENLMPGLHYVDKPVDGVVPHGTERAIQIDEAEADPLLTALYKGAGDQYIEVFTEKLGGPIGKALSKIPGATKLAALKAAVKARWLGRNKSRTLDDWFKKTAKESNFDGVINEMLEERAGEVLRPVTGVTEEYQAPTPSQLLAEAIAFMVPGALRATVETGQAKFEDLRRGKKLTKLKKERASPERRQELRGIAEEQRREEIVDAIMEAGALTTDLTAGTEEVIETQPPEVEEAPPPAPEIDQTAPVDPEENLQDQLDEALGQTEEAQEKVEEVEVAAEQTETEPTEAQKESGNYKKGKVSIAGMRIAIENPKGSTRSGKNKDGAEWQVTMPSHYGYFLGTEGKDKDPVDVYVGENPEAKRVWIINQNDAETGKFDEHKVMLGFNDANAAQSTYHRGFSDGKSSQRLGSTVALSVPEFKEWLRNRDKSKPATTPARRATVKKRKDGKFDVIHKKEVDKTFDTKAEAQKRASYLNKWEETVKKTQERKNKIGQFAKNAGKAFKVPYWNGMIYVTPSSKPGTQWQATRVDDRGPVGDAPGTWEEAAKSALEDSRWNFEAVEFHPSIKSPDAPAQLSPQDIDREKVAGEFRDALPEGMKHLVDSTGVTQNSYVSSISLEERLALADLGFTPAQFWKALKSADIEEAKRIARLTGNTARFTQAELEQVIPGPKPQDERLRKKIQNRMNREEVADFLGWMDLNGVQIRTPRARDLKSNSVYNGFVEAFGAGYRSNKYISPDGLAPDDVLEMYRRASDQPDMTLAHMYEQVATGREERRGRRSQVKKERELIELSEKQLLEFHEALLGEREGDRVPSGELSVGDKFLVNGELVTVTSYDPDTDLYVFDDGTKYGSSEVPTEWVIVVDAGSIEKVPVEGWVPVDQGAANAELTALKNKQGRTAVEEARIRELESDLGQKDLLDAPQQVAPEEIDSEREKQARMAKVAQLQSRRLTAGGVEIQGDLLGGAAEESGVPLFAQKETALETKRAVEQAFSEVKAFMAKVGLTGVRVVNSWEEAKVSTYSSGVATVVGNEVVVHGPNMAKSLARFSRNSQAELWLKRVMTHEAIHRLAMNQVTRRAIEEMWRSLPKSIQSEVLSTYTGTEVNPEDPIKGTGLSEWMAGHEYVRQFLELKLFGTRTEDVHTDVTVFSNVTAKVRAVLRKIAKALKDLVSSQKNPIAEQILSDLEAALKSPGGLELNAPVDISPGVEKGSEDLPFALMARTGQRKDELMASSELPQQQVRLINLSAFMQNAATVGHAARAWAVLPANIKAHLPFIKSRLTVIRGALGALGRNAPQQQSLEQMVSTLPEIEDQTVVVFDTWLNAHELREDAQKLHTRIGRVRKQLSNELKKGGKQNPRNVFIGDAVDAEIQRLTTQMGRVSASGGDPSQISAKIRLLRSYKTMDATHRVADVLISGQPLDFRVIRVEPVLGADIARVLQSHPDFSNQLTNLRGAARSPAAQTLDTLITELTQAQAWLSSQVIDRTTFQDNYRFAAESVGAEAIVVDEKKTVIEFEHPLDVDAEGSPKKVAIHFSPHIGVNEDNLRKLQDLAGAMETYLDPTKTQNRDPIRESAYRRQLDNIYRFYMNQSYSPAAGKLMPQQVDPFHLICANGFLGTPEGRVERIGGMAATHCLVAVRNYAQMHQMARLRLLERQNGLNLAINDAAKAHGMSIDEWITGISDPVISSQQEMGSIGKDVGSMILGNKVTAQDMAVIRRQKAFIDEITSFLRKIETTQNKVYPLQIRIRGENQPLPYLRDPQARGKLIMPRYTKRIAFSYGKEWARAQANAIEGSKSAEEKRRIVSEVLHGDQAFQDILVGHMRSMAGRPSYRRRIDERLGRRRKSPWVEAYRTIIRMTDDPETHDPNGTRPLTFDQVIRHIAASQSGVATEDLRSNEEIADQLLAEIGAFMSEVTPEKEVAQTAGHPSDTVNVTSADNFLTQPRGDQILPDTFLEYSAATNSSQARVINASNEVLGQRYLQALERMEEELSSQIDLWEGEIRDRVKAGETDAAAKLQRETRAAQIKGDLWYNYTEAQFHLRQVGISKKYMQRVVDPSTSTGLVVEEARGGFRIARALFAGSLLQSVGIVMRNRAGGALRQAQNDLMWTKSVRVFGMSIPWANLGVAPVKQLWETGRAFTRLFAGPFLTHKFFSSTAKGKAIRAAIENPNGQEFYSGWLGGIFRMLVDQSRRYEHMVELGVSGAQPYGEQLRAYRNLFWEGGRINADNPSGGKRFIRAMESVAGMVYETGVLTAFTAPRGALARVADMDANYAAGTAADSKIRILEENARRYLPARASHGALDPTTMLSPMELIGNRFATEKEAALVRLTFQKAGINIDAELINYFNRIQAAEAGVPYRGKVENTADVRLLDDAQYNSFFFLQVADVNKGDFANRPEAITTTEKGRNFGIFFGYGLWYNDKFKLAYSKFSKSGAAKGYTDGITMAGYWMFLVVLFGWFTEELIVRPMTMLLWNEERQTPRVTKAQTSGEAAVSLAKEAGPFMPIMGALVNNLVHATRPGSGVMESGIQLLPISLMNSFLATFQQALDEGSPTSAANAFVRQWFPNTRIVSNRLPYGDGYVEYNNVKRSLRAAMPSSIEMRQSGGGQFRRTSTSDNIRNVVNALSRPNGTDMSTARRERALAVAQRRSEGVANPENSVDQSILSKVPYRSILGRSPTEEEVALIESRMTESQIERLRRVESAFERYAADVDRPLRLRAEERSRGSSRRRRTRITR